MTRILGIPGALRRGSYNAALLRAAVELAPPEVAIATASIRDIPPYDADLEAESFAATGDFPAPVAALRAAIDAADALLLVTPEYNQSIPGVLKNALDWASSVGSGGRKDVFAGKPVALIGASNGLGATRMAQVAWLPVFRALGLRPWFGRQLYVPSAGKAFDAEGRLTDAKVRELLARFVAEYAADVARGRG